MKRFILTDIPFPFKSNPAAWRPLCRVMPDGTIRQVYFCYADISGFIVTLARDWDDNVIKHPHIN